LAQNSIARQTVDTQAALVQQHHGTLAADQAQVDAQKLNLAFTRIISPISGRVGLRRIDPGNYVQTSDAGGIVVITQIHPISVIFTLSGDELPAVMRRMRSGALLPVTAFDRTGTTRLGTGTLETVDNQIDTATGMIKLRALFDNAEEALFANQFVTVQLLLDTLHDKPVIPTASVQRGAPGTFVYVVKPDHTVAVQTVSLGPGSGERVAVADGLQPGQVVVVDGADRLRDGAKVRAAGSVRRADGAAGSQPGERPSGHRGRSSE
jgi:membrane fusion protein, multidrug efflux system